MTNLPSHYRAWCWQQGQQPGDLVSRTLTPRALQPNEVWVANHSIGLNPVDWKVLGSSSWNVGKVPGCDGAGTVIAVGANVDPDWLGQRVAYHQDLRCDGSFAELTAVAARALMALPGYLDFDTAASFPCPGLTAWQAISKAALQRENAILVSGAGGAVGHYLVQFAHAMGLWVDVLCHPRHWQRLQALGANRGFEHVDAALTAGRVYHAVIDAVSEQQARQLVPALRANGHLVCIQGRLSEWPNDPFGLSLSLHEVALGALHRYGDDDAWHTLTHKGEALLHDIQQGRLEPETLHRYDFESLPTALQDLRNRRVSGKLLVQTVRN